MMSADGGLFSAVVSTDVAYFAFAIHRGAEGKKLAMLLEHFLCEWQRHIHDRFAIRFGRSAIFRVGLQPKKHQQSGERSLGHGA